MTWQKREMDAETPDSILPRVLRKIKERVKGIDMPFPLKALNEITRGYPKGRVTTIAARTSHGKSAFVLQSAAYLAYAGKNAIYVSLEDDRTQITERLISLVMNKTNTSLQHGNLDGLDVNTMLERFKDINLFIIDAYGFDLTELDSIYNSVIFPNGKKADIIFHDYIQIIDNAKYETLSMFMKDVKQWCISKECAFVMASQQNRQHDMAPSNTGMKGTSSIEEASDLILLLYYPRNSADIDRIQTKFKEEFNYLSDEMKDLVIEKYFEISISKNKSGPIRYGLPFEFNGPTYTFYDWEGIESITKQEGKEEE